jgi:murein DD-endopeptidase MepM/ murein hydrolase activator NlpD
VRTLPVVAFAVAVSLVPLAAQTVQTQRPASLRPLIDFPTANRAILDGRPQDFYMYVDRNFEGENSKPWEGGQYGYVRGPQRNAGTIIYSSLHEGADIKPLLRDPSGVPLDPVLAAADGKVVYANTLVGASNYGRYVVIEHLIGGSPYYSLYAHLSSISASPGDAVRQGQPVGVIGFTGAGINKERAHVHFEFCLLLSRNFDAWHTANHPGEPNRHGIYNGRNLVGIDPAALLIAARKSPAPFNLPAHIRSEEACFKATIANSPHLDLLRHYPWLADRAAIAHPPAWTITFSKFGVPIRAEPCAVAVSEPVLAWIQPARVAYSHLTRGLVTGSPDQPRLSDSGRRFLSLLAWSNPVP